MRRRNTIVKFPPIFKPSDDDRYDKDHPGYHSKESGEGHEWHHHPEVRKYLVVSFLLGLSVFGAYLIYGYTTDHWRHDTGLIVPWQGDCPGISFGDQGQTPGQPGVCQYWHNYTTTICSGKPIHCTVIFHHDPRTHFRMAYNWTITGTDSQTHSTTSNTLSFNVTRDEYGFGWAVGGVTQLTVDRYTGDIVFCC